MARLLSVISGITARIGQAVAPWDRFWFTPAEASTLGLIRLLSGSLLVYTHAVWGLQFDAFFSDVGWQDPVLVRTVAPGPASASFWWSVPAEWRFTVHTLAVAILVSYTIGLGTRLTAMLAWLITVSYAHRVPQATFGLDQINTLLVTYLALANVCLPARDRLLSVDRVLYRLFARGDAAPRPRAVVSLATRLIQVHLSIIYLYSGLSKLKGETWWDGTAIWLAVANREYQSGDLTWLAWSPALVNLATVGTVAFEMLFPFLIWNPRFRPWLVAAGLSLHLAIGKFLGMWTFGIAMQLCYLSFLPPAWVSAILARNVRSGDRARTDSAGSRDESSPSPRTS